MKILDYMKEEDHRKALYASLIFIMLMVLFFLLVSLEEPDPPIPPDVIEMDLPEIEIEQGSQAPGGNDNAQDAAEPNPNDVQESTQDLAQQEDESTYVPSGNGNAQNDNTADSEPEPDSDFTFGGGAGQGDGNGTAFGNGDGVGGNGNGNTPGDGNFNPDRKVTTEPSFNANAQEEGIVALDIWVDANGNVIKTRFNESKSTTGNQYLIRLAEKAAKTMKYNKKPGVPSEKVGYKRFKFTKA
mgnify:CR=1 FL=1|tara:strand:- start:3730 stop:4455 length:726 start_codon:yes stop_codon:yes gene_type:complete